MENIKSIIRDFDIFLIIYILKTLTNEDNAMAVPKLSEQLNELIPSTDLEFFSTKTMYRRMNPFLKIEEFTEKNIQKINKLLPFILGGSIAHRPADGIMNGKNTKSTGKQQNRFYFDPILKQGDMDLICGSIRSSRYLSDEEKDYLIKRLHVILPIYNYNDNYFEEKSYQHILSLETLPKAPTRNTDTNLPMNASVLLKNIQLLHDAIEKELQIEVIYGTYDTDALGKIEFRPRNPDRPYILNPYAVVWNKGEYYLIATNNKYTNPVHFRLERIMSIKIHTSKTDSGELVEEKRSKIPNALIPFYKKISGEKSVFDSIKYANAYPEMKIYGKENKTYVSFECTSSSLQILVDYFGPNITLKASPIKHSEDELDYNGKPQKFLQATINNVQYENAYRFAIAQSEYLTLLGPKNLLDDVTNKMKDIAERYEKYNNR